MVWRERIRQGKETSRESLPRGQILGGIRRGGVFYLKSRRGLTKWRSEDEKTCSPGRSRRLEEARRFALAAKGPIRKGKEGLKRSWASLSKR